MHFLPFWRPPVWNFKKPTRNSQLKQFLFRIDYYAQNGWPVLRHFRVFIWLFEKRSKTHEQKISLSAKMQQRPISAGDENHRAAPLPFLRPGKAPPVSVSQMRMLPSRLPVATCSPSGLKQMAEMPDSFRTGGETLGFIITGVPADKGNGNCPEKNAKATYRKKCKLPKKFIMGKNANYLKNKIFKDFGLCKKKCRLCNLRILPLGESPNPPIPPNQSLSVLPPRATPKPNQMR